MNLTLAVIDKSYDLYERSENILKYSINQIICDDDSLKELYKSLQEFNRVDKDNPSLRNSYRAYVGMYEHLTVREKSSPQLDTTYLVYLQAYGQLQDAYKIAQKSL